MKEMIQLPKCIILCLTKNKRTSSVALGCNQIILTERPLLVGEVTANFCGYKLSRGQRNGFPRPLVSVF
jgi:hypothetical protein